MASGDITLQRAPRGEPRADRLFLSTGNERPNQTGMTRVRDHEDTGVTDHERQESVGDAWLPSFDSFKSSAQSRCCPGSSPPVSSSAPAHTARSVSSRALCGRPLAGQVSGLLKSSNPRREQSSTRKRPGLLAVSLQLAPFAPASPATLPAALLTDAAKCCSRGSTHAVLTRPCSAP